MKQATILLDSEPTQSEGDRIAFTFAAQHYQSDNFEWSVHKEVPDYHDVATADQFAAYAREAGGNACFFHLKVYED